MLGPGVRRGASSSAPSRELRLKGKSGCLRGARLRLKLLGVTRSRAGASGPTGSSSLSDVSLQLIVVQKHRSDRIAPGRGIAARLGRSTTGRRAVTSRAALDRYSSDVFLSLLLLLFLLV